MNNKSFIILAFFLSVVCLFLFTVSRWYINNISNSQEFTKNMVTVLQEQEVRDVMSEEIINKALVDYPVVRRLAGEYLQPALSGVLASPQIQTIYTKAISSLHKSAAAPVPYDLSLDISRVRTVIVALTLLANLTGQENSQLAQVDVNKIPEEIVIVSKDDIPSIYPITLTLSWLGPITGLVFVTLLALGFYKAKDRIYAVKIFGAILSVFSVLFYFGLPYVQNIVLSYMVSDLQRVIFSNFYSLITAGLSQVIIIYLIIGLVSLTVGYILSTRVYKKIPASSLYPNDTKSASKSKKK